MFFNRALVLILEDAPSRHYNNNYRLCISSLCELSSRARECFFAFVFRIGFSRIRVFCSGLYRCRAHTLWASRVPARTNYIFACLCPCLSLSLSPSLFVFFTCCRHSLLENIFFGRLIFLRRQFHLVSAKANARTPRRTTESNTYLKTARFQRHAAKFSFAILRATGCRIIFSTYVFSGVSPTKRRRDERKVKRQ